MSAVCFLGPNTPVQKATKGHCWSWDICKNPESSVRDFPATALKKCSSLTIRKHQEHFIFCFKASRMSCFTGLIYFLLKQMSLLIDAFWFGSLVCFVLNSQPPGPPQVPFGSGAVATGKTMYSLSNSFSLKRRRVAKISTANLLANYPLFANVTAWQFRKRRYQQNMLRNYDK